MRDREREKQNSTQRYKAERRKKSKVAKTESGRGVIEAPRKT